MKQRTHCIFKLMVECSNATQGVCLMAVVVAASGVTQERLQMSSAWIMLKKGQI